MNDQSATQVNSIRLDGPGSLLTKGEPQTLSERKRDEGKPAALKGNVTKRPWGAIGWLEAEWLEASGRESERPVRESDGVHCPRGTKNRRTGVRAFIVAMKRSNVRRAKGRRKVDCVKDALMQANRTDLDQSGRGAVPERALQVREADPAVRARWAWVEASAWTDRMLTALEQGVQGGVWFTLIDKVHSGKNLQSAWSKVASNKGSAGVDRVTVEMYGKDVEANLRNLSEKLRRQTYQPKAIRRVYIPKAGSSQMRPLGIPTVGDRVVQTALRSVLEPIFEKEFARHSYGFRPGRGCKDALRRVDELLGQGYQYVVDADLKSYFDTIPHGPLMERVRERVADGRVLKLIEQFLTQGVMEGLSQWTPDAGAPQGAVISPLLSNIYLNPLDHEMEQRGWAMVRYADDFVILCQSEQEAREALEQVRQWTAQAGLTLHPQKTRIVDAGQEGFDFLGYHFNRGRKWPRKKSVQKLRETIRSHTRRTSGISMPRIIDQVNRTLRGWFGYFKHSHRTTFPSVDGWVRMRLRSILRKRHGKRGRGRGSDHQRWPNRYFAELGLFSLTQAHALACQSAARR